MGTTAEPNANYVGAVNANDKYNPFIPKTLRLDPEEGRIFDWMLTNRMVTLKSLGYKPSELQLDLAVRDDARLIANEKNKLPPVVVVSSNRSQWIQKGLVECDRILGDKPGFRDVMDLDALNKEGGISPPIYCPKRVNESNRNVYVVVHMNEYKTYRQALDPYGITVVGWEFRRPRTNLLPVLVGFGASRFAAIEFCKHLHNTSGAVPCAWLFDDNVVAMSLGFAGLQQTEGELTANHCCFGFDALPAPKPRQVIQLWAKNGGTNPREGVPKVSSFGPVFQQAVLWNINYLNQKKINFGITYVASAEDVSLSRFINSQKLSSTFQDSVVILKEVPEDNKDDQGAQKVVSARKELERLFAKIESAVRPANPPPPVNVLLKDGDGTARTIANFIENLVTKAQQEAVNVRATCQAAEQITKTAIGLKFVGEGVQATFQEVQTIPTFHSVE
jgi:hypothetical protein